MSTAPKNLEDLRQRILKEPSMILEDADVMRALVDANEKAMGHNIVDLRSVAMDRLESRLARLEEMHKSVIAAAYENLAGTNQVQRAVLKLLEATICADYLSIGQHLLTAVAELTFLSWLEFHNRGFLPVK